MSGAVFIYPPAGNFSDVAPSGLVNIFDTLEVAYTSSWDALNLTLFCLANDVPTDYQVWQVPTNPIAASGTYRLESIYSVDFTIYKFPTWCSFKLTQYGNNDIARGGENFQVVSVPGTSATYRSTAATTLPAPTPTSRTDMTSTTQSSTVASTSTNSSSSETDSSSHPSSSDYSSSASATASSIPSSTSGQPSILASPTSSTLASEPNLQETGLSAGAKAGICIGICVILLVIAILCFMVFRLRRKINKTGQGHRNGQEDVQKLRSELPMYTASQDHKPGCTYSTHELEHRSRVELPIQETVTAPIELQGSRWLR